MNFLTSGALRLVMLGLMSLYFIFESWLCDLFKLIAVTLIAAQ